EELRLARLDKILLLDEIDVEIRYLGDQLRAALTHGPARMPFGTHHEILPYLDLGQDLRPHHRFPIVHHYDLDQARVHHLQDVFVLERIGQRHDLHRRLARLPEPIVQGEHTGVIAAARTQVDGLAGQVLYGR